VKSLRIRGVAGNVKLRGKMTKLLHCRCCEMINFKQQERWKEAKQEVKNFKKED
jgi:hypothetical protein